MAGKVVVSTLNDDTGVLATQNGMTGIAKAWVNFDGTGTVAIRGSFNVSSITDNGTGDYTVNFTTAMPNINYALIGSFHTTAGSTCFSPFMNGAGTLIAPTTTAARFITNTNAGVIDPVYVNVAVFSS